MIFFTLVLSYSDIFIFFFTLSLVCSFFYFLHCTHRLSLCLSVSVCLSQCVRVFETDSGTNTIKRRPGSHRQVTVIQDQLLVTVALLSYGNTDLMPAQVELHYRSVMRLSCENHVSPKSCHVCGLFKRIFPSSVSSSQTGDECFSLDRSSSEQELQQYKYKYLCSRVLYLSKCTAEFSEAMLLWLQQPK